MKIRYAIFILFVLLLTTVAAGYGAVYFGQQSTWLNMTEQEVRAQSGRVSAAHYDLCLQAGGQMSPGGFTTFGQCWKDGRVMGTDPDLSWWVKPVLNPERNANQFKQLGLMVLALLAGTGAFAWGLTILIDRESFVR